MRSINSYRLSLVVNLWAGFRGETGALLITHAQWGGPVA